VRRGTSHAIRVTDFLNVTKLLFVTRTSYCYICI